MSSGEGMRPRLSLSPDLTKAPLVQALESDQAQNRVSQLKDLMDALIERDEIDALLAVAREDLDRAESAAQLEMTRIDEEIRALETTLGTQGEPTPNRGRSRSKGRRKQPSEEAQMSPSGRKRRRQRG